MLNHHLREGGLPSVDYSYCYLRENGIVHDGLWMNENGFGMLKHAQKNPSKNNCIRLPRLGNHNVVCVVQQEFVFLCLIPPVGTDVRS